MTSKKQVSDPMGLRFPATPSLPDDLRTLVVFGGTFDPPHRAHITLLKQAARTLQCQHSLLVPANRSPHKTNMKSTASGHQRFEMLCLLTLDDAEISVTPFEVERPPPSFTVSTLEALCEAIGSPVNIRLLMGSDQAVTFHRWYRWQRILELATPAVLLRPPHESGWNALLADGLDPKVIRPEWVLTNLPTDVVNATEIRQRIRKGGDVADLVPEVVMDYIRGHHLYET